MRLGIRNIRISIRNRLIVAFLAVVILPLAITFGFYYIAAKIQMQNVDFAYRARDVAADVARDYAGRGSFDGTQKVLERYKQGIKGRIQVIDVGGRVVADTMPGKEPGAKSYTVSELAEMFVLPANDMQLNRQATDYRNFKMHVGTPVKINGKLAGLVIVSYEYQDLIGPVYGILMWTLFVLIGAILVICLLFAWLISRGITRPLRELVTATRYIAEGNLDSRVKINARNELGDLGEAFNIMVDNLQQSLSREKALESSRRELIANVSHDLRTPLTSIRGYVEGIRDGVASDPDKVKRYLDVIHEKTVGLERLINDLFHLSQLDVGQLEMRIERADAVKLLEGVARRFRPDIETAGLSFTEDIPETLPPVSIDRDRIEQALNNIVENAIKYTPAGGTIALSASEVTEGIRITVEDTGDGISPEDLPHVFERLYRGEKSRSRRSGGTGLGLAIAKQVVEGHGGSIWAESEKGRGSRLHLVLPRAR